MGSCNCSVEQAIRNALSPGQELETPAGGSVFVVESFDYSGIKVSKLAQRISWRVLNGVPKYMALYDRCEVAIGAIMGSADLGTLEKHLQDGHGNKMMRGSYVAPILEAAGVIDILPKVGKEKQRIRLTSKWNSRC